MADKPCDKIWYPTRRLAMRGKRLMKAKKAALYSIYNCPRCCGYHLTKQPRQVKHIIAQQRKEEL
jgi:hypothetical protein